MSKSPNKLLNFTDFDEYPDAPEITVSQPKNITKQGTFEFSPEKLLFINFNDVECSLL